MTNMAYQTVARQPTQVLPAQNSRTYTLTSQKHNLVVARILDLVQIAKRNSNWEHSLRILDVGCGLGYLTEALTTRSHDAVGRDCDEPCVNITSNYGKAYHMDANRIGEPFADQRFDIVISKD